jgi:carbon-monoxide dehydrogenase medium subunit
MRAAGAEKVLAGKELRKILVRDAVRVASEEAQPITDIRGPAQYRRALVETIVRRAIQNVASS